MAGNITEYNAGSDAVAGAIRPSEVGVEATVQSAYRGGRFFDQGARDLQSNAARAGQEIGSGIAAAGDQAVKYVQDREINLGGPAEANTLAGLTATWNKIATTSDPNDPTVAQKFQDQTLEPALQKFQDSFNTEGGRKWAQERVQAIRSHFVNDTLPHDMAVRGAGAAQGNVQNYGNTLTATVQADPTSLDYAMKSVDSYVPTMFDSMVPGAKGAVARDQVVAELKGNLFKAAVAGWSQKGTAGIAQAKKLLADPAYAQYQDNPEQLQRYTDSMTRLTIEQQKYHDEIALKQAKAGADSRTDQYLAAVANGQPVKFTDLAVDPAYKDHPEWAGQALKLVQAFSKSGDEVSPVLSHSTTLDLMRRMTLPDGDANQIATRDPIDKAFTQGLISKPDYQFLLGQNKALEQPAEKQLAGARADFFKNYAGVIDPSRTSKGMFGQGGATALGNANLYRAQQDAMQQENALRAQGKSPAEIAQLLYTDTGSQQFFGRATNLGQYHTSLDASKLFQTQNEQGNGASPMSTFAADFPSPDMFKAAQTIKSIEDSGGNYQTVGNPTTRKDGSVDYPLGAFGIMASNVPSWTAKYLGHAMTPDQFLKDPHAQNKVFAGEFGRLEAKYGFEGAARAWYAGEGGMNNLNATDVNRRLNVGQYGALAAGRYGQEAPSLAGLPRWNQNESRSDILKKYAPGTKIILPDGTTGVVPHPKATSDKISLPGDKIGVPPDLGMVP